MGNEHSGEAGRSPSQPRSPLSPPSSASSSASSSGQADKRRLGRHAADTLSAAGTPSPSHINARTLQLHAPPRKDRPRAHTEGDSNAPPSLSSSSSGEEHSPQAARARAVCKLAAHDAQRHMDAFSHRSTARSSASGNDEGAGGSMFPQAQQGGGGAPADGPQEGSAPATPVLSFNFVQADPLQQLQLQKQQYQAQVMSQRASASRPNQFLSLDFLPASSPHASSAPPTLPVSAASSTSSSPSPPSYSGLSTGSGSGCPSSSSFVLPPPHAASATRHASFNGSTHSSLSSPKIPSAAAAAAGHRMPPRSPHSPSLRLTLHSPPRMTRPVSEPNAIVSSPSAGSPVPSSPATGRESCRTVETAVVRTQYNASGQKQINQYVVEGGEIGRGSYGTVKLVFNTLDNHYYAMKVMNKSLLKKRRIMGFSAGLTASATRTASMGGPGAAAALKGALTNGATSSTAQGSSAPSDNWTNVQREIAIMKALTHPNIVRLYEVMDDPSEDQLYLVMEYMSHGSIMGRGMEQLRALPLEIVWSYFRDIVLGLEYLHFCNIIHRDLKPENILHGESGHCKLSDFGVSMLCEGGDDRITTSGTTVGSAAFLAPELCGGGLGVGGSAAGSGSRGIGSVPTVTAATAAAVAGVASPKKPTPALLAALESSTGRNNPFGADGRSFSMPVGVAPPIVVLPPAPGGSSGPPARSSSDSSSQEISGKKGDIWALGVTLYVMLFGRLPFHAKTVHLLYRAIVEDALAVPPSPLPPSSPASASGAGAGSGSPAFPSATGMGSPSLFASANPNPNHISPETHPELVDLLHRMLDKNPHTRISIREIKAHPWVTKGGAEPMEEQCDYEGVGGETGVDGHVSIPSSPNASSTLLCDSRPAVLEAACQRRLERSSDRLSQQLQHVRSSSGGRPLDVALEEDEDALTDTDVEVDGAEEDASDRVSDLAKQESVVTRTASASVSLPIRPRRPSRSNPRLSITNADVLGAVTLVSKVCMVVNLKVRMRKARENIASNRANNARARSSSMGDMVMSAPPRMRALRTTDPTSSSEKPLPSSSPRVSGAFSCLSPSLSAHTHISVPVGHEFPGAGPASQQAKRRAVGPASDLLAEARAAISRGATGPAAAQKFSERTTGESAQAASVDTSSARLYRLSPPAGPLSPPPWNGHGRSIHFPHRRGSPRTPRTPLTPRTPREAPEAGASTVADALEDAATGATDASASHARHSPPPLSMMPLDDRSSAPAATPAAASAAASPVTSSDASLGVLPPSRHQSAPLRPAPPVFVPFDKAAVLQPHSLSCNGLDEEILTRARMIERQQAATAAAAAQVQAQIQMHVHMHEHGHGEVSVSSSRRASHSELHVHAHSVADACSDSDLDGEDELVEAVEPDQDLLDI